MMSFVIFAIVVFVVFAILGGGDKEEKPETRPRDTSDVKHIRVDHYHHND